MFPFEHRFRTLIYCRRTTTCRFHLIETHHFSFKEITWISKNKCVQCICSFPNSGTKYAGNKILRQIQNFPVCYGNVLAKKTAQDLVQTFTYQDLLK